MGLFPYTFESEKPHHIKNIFVMGLDKRSLHNSSQLAAGKMVKNISFHEIIIRQKRSLIYSDLHLMPLSSNYR